jgi:hypothetical protein
MPYTIIKIGKLYKVINSQTGKVHSKGTTKEKAEKQITLLHMIDKLGKIKK